MVAFFLRFLGIAKIIYQYLVSPQGRIVTTWAANAVDWVHEAASDQTMDKSERFLHVSQRVEAALVASGTYSKAAMPLGVVRKIVELAHGAWQERQAAAPRKLLF